MLKYVYSIRFLEGNVKIGGIHHLTESVLVLSGHSSATLSVMKRYLAMLALLLISGPTRAAPSTTAPSLAILVQNGTLCYSASIIVNDKTDAVLGKQAEAIMLKTLNSLAFKAKQYDTADSCDRELIFSFSIDNAGAPTVYTDDLKLHSYIATEGPVELVRATVWTDGYWGGDVKVFSIATLTKRMQDDLTQMLSKFTTDYRSVVK